MNNKTLTFLSATITVLLVVGCSQENRPPPGVLPEHTAATSSVPVPVEEDEAGSQYSDAAREHRAESVQLPAALPSSQLASEPRKRQVAGKMAAADLSRLRLPAEAVNRENYAHFDDNPVKRVVEQPVSTFSIDVDTGAYSNVRRLLNAGQLPVRDAVRAEEMINYFAYDYPTPVSEGQPFSLHTELGPNPWNSQTRLLHIGIKGYQTDRQNLPAANLVFLVDVSGSMQSADKLGLLKSALTLLTRQMRAQDRISLVVYAGASGIVLEPVSGKQQAKIRHALEGLTAGGRTNGAAGIRLAYQVAQDAFIEGGINRVIIATDGDFNVGTVSFEALLDLVKQKRRSGIALTTLGFGTGNYNDHLMEQLADAGDGNYAYIDTLNEARKVLVEEMGSTLRTIARDVKIQVEFNPALVAEYRLIGYENRALKREDFNNDKVDAGDIGAGHTVTAIYELALRGKGGERVEALRYAQQRPAPAAHTDELAMLRLRYKQPQSADSRLIETAILQADIQPKLTETSDRYRFSAAVAGFAQLLRGGQYLHDFDHDAILELARDARSKDNYGYRGEFIQLVGLADSLSERDVQASR